MLPDFRWLARWFRYSSEIEAEIRAGNARSEQNRSFIDSQKELMKALNSDQDRLLASARPCLISARCFVDWKRRVGLGWTVFDGPERQYTVTGFRGEKPILREVK